jgi:protein-S-isoprenylcysteine O-methyltransferase Ste14
VISLFPSLVISIIMILFLFYVFVLLLGMSWFEAVGLIAGGVGVLCLTKCSKTSGRGGGSGDGGGGDGG